MNHVLRFHSHGRITPHGSPKADRHQAQNLPPPPLGSINAERNLMGVSQAPPCISPSVFDEPIGQFRRACNCANRCYITRPCRSGPACQIRLHGPSASRTKKKKNLSYHAPWSSRTIKAGAASCFVSTKFVFGETPAVTSSWKRLSNTCVRGRENRKKALGVIGRAPGQMLRAPRR